MPSTERERSRDSERIVRHQPSASSDSGRAIVPMWDSSDPERAPPPLPMNPSSPIVATSRPNTSSAIQSAHAALTEKARESSYITNAIPKRIEASPERSLIKGAAHKRMQSFHSGHVRDLSSFLEGGSSFGSPKSPEKSSGRPATPHANKEFPLESRSPEKSNREFENRPPERISREFLLEGRLPEKTPTNKDFFLEGRSLEKTSKEFLFEGRSPEKEKTSSRSATPTPGRDTPTRDMPSLRPSLRRPPQSILGENTPPQSATMLALQNMAIKDVDIPLSNVTNSSTALVRTPQTFDVISNQILGLTSIATSLQREMAQLSRRSKDNATDLVSLKEATNARDEDIRKSLRELVQNLSEPPPSRSPSNIYGHSLFLDSKPHNSPGSRGIKTFTLPRIPSPNSFSASLDRESMVSPSSFCPDGAATVTLLEKIIREMGTKEGQENLLSRLTEIADRLSRDGSSTAGKVDDLVKYIKTNTPQDLVHKQIGGGGGSGGNRPRNFSFEDETPRLELDFDRPTSGPMMQRVEALLGNGKHKENIRGSSGASDILTEEILKIIRSIKDSVSQGGGLTAEVKALVRELRGEVLGMGREIGRKLEEAENKSASSKDMAAGKEHVTQVVQDGLEELKQHMDHILNEHRRQSASQASHNQIDYQEIYNAMHSAISEKEKERNPELGKEDIVEAVKEAWENYKPDIELQHFGLEREELLVCLKDGIEQYAPQDNSQAIGGATREEVFTAVVEGLKHFSPPKVEIEASLSREEILDAVRECLEEFEFPSAPAPEPREPEITRDDMLDAVKEGLHAFDFAATTAAAAAALSRDPGGELTRDDMVDAVREGLHTFDFAASTTKDSGVDMGRDVVLEAVKEGLNSFDFAANVAVLSQEIGGGLSREHVLDAVKEGLQTYDFTSNITALSQDGGGGGGLTRDDVFDAVKSGLGEQPPMEAFVEQIFERLQDIEATIRSEFQGVSEEAKQNIAANGRDTEQLLDATKDGFEKLRADIEVYIDHATEDLGSEEILASLQVNFEALRKEFEQNVSKGSETALEAVQGELEHLRETLATSLVRNDATNDKDEIINALREGLASIRTELHATSLIRNGAPSDKEEIINTLREDIAGIHTELHATSLIRNGAPSDKEEIINTLREDIAGIHTELHATSLIRNGAPSDKEEIINTLREDIAGIRTELDRPRDPTESILSGTGEILDALQDGLTGLKTEVEKIGSKPVDMTVNYEILETLKAGLEGVRADLDKLRENANEERSVAQISDRAIISTEGLKRNDIANLEILITQLRIKVEALEAMPLPPPMAVPGSLSKSDLENVEQLLHTVQVSVANLSAKERSVNDEAVTREDMEAIETLLRNTKAKIDDMDPEQTVKKEHFDTVEALMLETRDDMHQLSTHLEDVSKRDDVTIIEALVRDIITGLDDMKDRAAVALQDPEKVTKTDVEAVEAVCLDLKASIEQMVQSDIAALASKEDVKHVQELVKEFKDRIETHADTNAKAFEERQAETVGVAVSVSEVKASLQEFRDTLKEKLDEGSTNLETLGKFLETLGETIGQNANITHDVKEMFETMKTEFEKSSAGVVGSKLETDEKFQQTWARFDVKIDDKINELMARLDEAQVAAEARDALGEEKKLEIEAAMLGTKTVAEELKLLVDTLGTTLTESVEKMDEASKTVFGRVEEAYIKLEENHAENKTQHSLTREEVTKTYGSIERVRNHVTEYNPKLLESIKDVLLIVGQHYEHSKTATTTLQHKIDSIPPPPPPVEFPILPEPKEYDDSQTQEKLNKLVDHMHAAGKSFAQLDMLDKIHQQAMQTAAEVSQFVSAQTLRIEEEHEDKEKAVEAATIALEKRLAQKDAVEATVSGLKEEEERLKRSVAHLRDEQDDLAHQKMRLAADVSSLETALRIRREELQAMEARAEGLERRILEGVIDHSRALLLSKQNHGRDAMSRKRVPSHAPSTTGSVSSSVASRASNTTQSAVSMAMGGNRVMATVPINNPAGASRRILSLNQITHNVPTGGSGGFKRSQSVRTPHGAGVVGSLRKSSWGGSMSQNYGELNKENLSLKESEEEEEVEGSEAEGSEHGTMRRSSRGTTIMTRTGTGLSEGLEEGTDYTGSEDGDDHHDGATIEPSSLVLYEESSGGQIAQIAE